MRDTAKRLMLAALAPDSLLRAPPDWDGNLSPWTIPGLNGVPRPMPWDVWVSAHAPGLREETVNLVVRDDGAIVCRQGLPAELLDPLADAVTEELGPPFVAVGVRDEGDVWVVAANAAEIVELPGVSGNEIDVSRIDGVVSTRQDSADCDQRFPGLEALLEGDDSLVAHRFAADTWVVELFPL